MGVERAAGRKDHGRGTCERDEQHQAEGKQGQSPQCLQQRLEAVPVGDKARAWNRPLNRLTDPGRVGPLLEVDVDNCRQRQIGFAAGWSQPSFQGSPQIFRRYLLDARHAGLCLCDRYRRGCPGNPIADLDGIAMLNAAFDHRGGVGECQPGRADHHHDEGHDGDQDRHRAPHSAGRDHPAFGIRGDPDAHGLPSPALGGDAGGCLKRAGRIHQDTLFQPNQLRPRCRGDQAKIMGGNNDRRSQSVHRRQQVENPLRHGRIDVAGRLVGNDQLRPRNDGAGNGDALLLSARQGRRASAGPVGEPDPGEHFPHRAFDLLLAMAGDAQRQGDIVER